MARRKSGTLTEVELEFMHILWAEKEASPEDVQRMLLKNDRELTGGTIRKMLFILLKKGYVTRVKDGKKYLYSPLVQQKQAKRNMICELADRAFGGSTFNMVAALLDTGYVTEDIEKIEKLIAERKKERGK
jgi:BlaI family transcriptional regulator, penicillinase repressor